MIDERERPEQDRDQALDFLRHLEVVDGLIRRAGDQDLQAMNDGILEAMLSIFDCDRAWLLYPADPAAATWTTRIERTRPDFPGVLAQGRDVPMSDSTRDIFRTALAAAQPVTYGPGQDLPLAPELTEGFAVQSQVVLAIRTRHGQPWLLGLHHCSRPAPWSAEERNLLGEIGRRLADGLDTMLLLQNLQESQARLEFAIRATGLGILEWDLPTRTLSFSEPWLRMTGHGPGDLEPRMEALMALVHPDDAQLVTADLREVLAGRKELHTLEHRLRHKQGHWLWVQSQGLVTARDARGRATHLLGTQMDITERKAAEAERVRLQSQLLHSQKLENLGSMAGGVAHDMNNVLAAILALAAVHLRCQPEGSPAHQAFETISKAATRGGKLVKGLLNFARKSPAEEHTLDLNAVIQEEIQILERTTLSHVRLETDLERGLRPMRGDASALSNALMNLCVNAVDALPANGTLTLRTRNVDRAWIEVAVEDTGLGMTEEVLQKAREPFFTTKGAGKGTGLGLSMVQAAVTAHRGQMEIQSQLGRGTCVKLRFPSCDWAPLEAEPEAAAWPGSSWRSLSVLLVDDDELIQSSMEAILEALGHSVALARCGEAALGKLEAGLEPDVVILDMNMPGLGGQGTLPRLRALRPTLPVLLSTGGVDQEALDLVSAHPGVALLAKPYSLRELQGYFETLSGP